MLQNKKVFFPFKALFARTRLAYEQTEHGNAVTNVLTIGGSDQDLNASECVAQLFSCFPRMRTPAFWHHKTLVRAICFSFTVLRVVFTDLYCYINFYAST